MNKLLIARLAAHAAVLTLAALSVPVSAFQPLLTDDAGTQGSGGNQLEVSLNRDRTRAVGDITLVRALPIVYTRGLTPTIDVFAGVGYGWIGSNAPGGDATGTGNPWFGAKWRYYQAEESDTGLAVKTEVLLPVDASLESAGLGKGRTSGSLTLILSQAVPFGAIHINAGVARERYRDALRNPDATTTRASISPVWDLSDAWKLAIDLGAGSTESGGAALRTHHIGVGAIYSPHGNLDVALGFFRLATHDTPRTVTHAASAGITWRFP